MTFKYEVGTFDAMGGTPCYSCWIEYEGVTYEGFGYGRVLSKVSAFKELWKSIMLGAI
jgi:hypothetical protein